MINSIPVVTLNLNNNLLMALTSKLLITNQAIDINTLSRRVFAHGKASKRRCSTPTASFDNAVREQTRDGLSLNI
jgi:hypothetical protein